MWKASKARFDCFITLDRTILIEILGLHRLVFVLTFKMVVKLVIGIKEFFGKLYDCVMCILHNRGQPKFERVENIAQIHYDFFVVIDTFPKLW